MSRVRNTKFHGERIHVNYMYIVLKPLQEVFAVKSASVSKLAFGNLCEIRENASKHQYALYWDESPVIHMQMTL